MSVEKRNIKNNYLYMSPEQKRFYPNITYTLPLSPNLHPTHSKKKIFLNKN